MAERGYSENFKTPDCTLGFDRYLLEPQTKTNDAGKEFQEYGATLIFSNSTPKAVFEKAIMEACVAAGWGNEAKIVDMIKKSLIKSPFLAGDGKEAVNKKTGDLHPGMGPDVWFVRTNTRVAPPVRFKDPNIQASKQEVYAGCTGFAVLNAYTWENKQNGKGVTFGLQYFQKRADGTPHYTGGARPVDANQYYETVEDNGAAPEETKAGAGAGGLFG